MTGTYRIYRCYRTRVTPKTVISVPTEYKFNITLTIRRSDKSLGHHGARFRHPVGTVHCGDEASHNLRSVQCRSRMGHPRGRR